MRKGTWKDFSMEEYAMGEENSNEGAQDFLALFNKKNEKNMKKFFLLKVRSSIKT